MGAIGFAIMHVVHHVHPAGGQAECTQHLYYQHHLREVAPAVAEQQAHQNKAVLHPLVGAHEANQVTNVLQSTSADWRQLPDGTN
jgi:hypothetical protein